MFELLFLPANRGASAQGGRKMRILFLAPHPLYQDRGTPIDVYLLLKALTEHGHTIDVVTYHEGRDIELDRVKLYRIRAMPLVTGIRPGFSIKKLICDCLMWFPVLTLVRRHQYDVAIGVEESVFILRILKAMTGLPYVYDMDSSLPQQMVEKHAFLSPFSRLITWFERWAVRGALAVVPVCDELANGIASHQPRHIVVLNDISLLEEYAPKTAELRESLGVEGLVVLYVGNLEHYQGVDLLIQSFADAQNQGMPQANLVLVGGEPDDIQRYAGMCDGLGVRNRVHFLGQKDVSELGAYLAEADIVVSPRTKGKNTPMKIYSYLQSGTAVLATDLITHTQVLNRDVAMLAAPFVPAFSAALRRLANDPELRARLGRAGKQLIEDKYSYRVYREKVHGLLNYIQGQIKPQPQDDQSTELSESTAR